MTPPGPRRVRRLYPEPAGSVGLADAYPVPSGGRHLRLNMVTSLDGAAMLDGRVGALSGPTDRELMYTLRSVADVVLVGAGTLRSEGYGPWLVPGPMRRVRDEAGRSPSPRLAVISGRLDLDLTAAAFTRATAPPIVFTAATSPADRRAAVAAVAEVVVCQGDQVDLAAALAALAARGLVSVLGEGGPRVAAQLFAADLVDELCLTVAPRVAGGHGPRITSGSALTPPPTLRIEQVLEDQGYLFLRYRRSPGD